MTFAIRYFRPHRTGGSAFCCPSDNRDLDQFSSANSVLSAISRACLEVGTDLSFAVAYAWADAYGSLTWVRLLNTVAYVIFVCGCLCRCHRLSALLYFAVALPLAFADGRCIVPLRLQMCCCCHRAVCFPRRVEGAGISAPAFQ